MGRGGPGQRRRLAELSERSSYRLNGVQRGSRITMCLDKYGRWEGGYRVGTIMRTTRDSVWILWDTQPDFEVWSQGDARYEVDRGRCRITAPQRATPLDLLRGVRRADAETLTSPDAHGKMGISPISSDRKTEGGSMTDTTLSAKQVATKLGTDAKTFRRFLRSASCSIEPVGQGGRYEFNAKDVEALKNQFLAWRKPGSSTPKLSLNGSTKKKPTDPPKRKKHVIDDDPLDIRLISTIAQRQQGAAMANDIEAEEDFDLEPSDEELAELEDLDLDDIE